MSRSQTQYPIRQNNEEFNTNFAMTNKPNPQVNMIQNPVNANRFNPCINEEDLKSDYQENDFPQRRGSIARKIKRSNSFSHKEFGLAQYTRFEDDDDEDAKEQEQVILNPKKTNPSGIRYTNTFFFDDYENMIKGHKIVRMKELRVIHDKNFIFGLQGIYEINGEVKTSQYHCFTNLPYSAVNEAIVLADEEYITSIEGSFVEVINGLKITTSKGLVYSFGIIDLSIHYSRIFRIAIPAGKKS